MLTWLDEWCQGMALRRRQNLSAAGKQSDEFCKSDGLAAREATLDALNAESNFVGKDHAVPLPVAFLSALAPFFCAPSMHPVVRAFQVTPELVHQLERDIVVGAEATSDTRRMLEPSWRTYIDIPPGLIQVGDLSELRAVFAQPARIIPEPTVREGEQDAEVLMYCAVVAPRGRYGWRHAMWTDDRSQFVCDNYHHEGLEPEVAAMPTFAEILSRANMPAEQFQDIVEWLAHAVANHAQDLARARVEILPHLPAESDRRIRGRGGDVADRFSLFRVERVVPRTRDQGAQAALGGKAPAVEDSDQRRTWRLDHRIIVRAHERNQPFGPRGSGQRRVVLIAQHEKGPVDGPPLHPLQQV
jgi:hypothetical protein